MLDLFDLALDIQEKFEKLNYSFCFIRGLALQAWGENRVTQDVDISLFTGFKDEEKFVDEIMAIFPARIHDARNFALNTSRVLLLKSKNNIGIDISLAGMPFEQKIIDRSLNFEFFPGKKIRICCAEDLIVMKGFAGRDKDFTDIKGVVVKQKEKINEDYVLTFLSELAELKEEPELVLKVQEIFRKYGNM